MSFLLLLRRLKILQFFSKSAFHPFVCRPVTNVGGRVSHGGSQFSRGNIENHLNWEKQRRLWKVDFYDFYMTENFCGWSLIIKMAPGRSVQYVQPGKILAKWQLWIPSQAKVHVRSVNQSNQKRGSKCWKQKWFFRCFHIFLIILWMAVKNSW